MQSKICLNAVFYLPLFVFTSVLSRTTDATPDQILIVSDSKHFIYGKYAEIALSYMMDDGRQPGYNMEVTSLEVPRNDTDAAFEKICLGHNQFRSALQADLILDMSVLPLISATVKSFAKFADIPSASLMCCTNAEAIQKVLTDDDDYQQHLVFDSPAKIWFRAIRDYVVDENMTTAAILLDDSFELERAHRMLLTNLPCKHIIIQMNFDDEVALHNFTTKMIVQAIRNFFIVASTENAGKFLEEAYNLDLVDSGRPPKWFVLTKDQQNIQCTQCSAGNIVKLRPLLRNVTLRDHFLTFVNQKSTSLMRLQGYNEIDMLYTLDAVTVLVRALQGKNQSKPIGDKETRRFSCEMSYSKGTAHREIRNSTKTKVAHLLGYLLADTHEGVLGKIIAGSQNNNSFLDAKLVVEHQTIEYENTNITFEYGTWSHTNGLQDTQGRRPRAITSKIYRVTILVEEPFIFRNGNITDSDRTGERTKYNYTGYLIDLIQKIADELKFEYELYEVPDDQFGAVDENGEWNGLIRELVDKKADIALAPLSVMAERENVVDFTVPYFDLVGISILMKKNIQEQSLFKFVTVLEGPVWGSILGAYLLTSLLMFVFDRWSPYSYRNLIRKDIIKDKKQPVEGRVTKQTKQEESEEQHMNVHEEYGTRVFTLKESLWFCMTSLTPQGGGEAPRNLSGRLVAATWWMFGFIIIASYTANLAAFLTVSRLETQIDSLDALAKQYGIRYAALENSATETYFKRMWKIEEKFYEIWRDMSLNESMSDKDRAELAVWDYPVSDKYTKLWLTMKDFDKPKTYEEGVEWVKKTRALPSGEKEGFALIGDTAILQYKANLDCNLTLVGEEFSRKPYALAVQEGSVLRDDLSGVILKLLNQRELELMKDQWWQMKNQRSCNTDGEENEGINIENIGGVFILVLVGTILACIMLAFEYYWYKRRGTKKSAE